MIETLQDAAYQQMQAEVSQMTASFQLPEAQEQALDEYPMPDEQVSTPDMQMCIRDSFTEDTLRSAMETAGKEDMPEDAERKGLGTPATRAGILEKLVSAGFLERKKSRKTVRCV